MSDDPLFPTNRPPEPASEGEERTADTEQAAEPELAGVEDATSPESSVPEPSVEEPAFEEPSVDESAAALLTDAAFAMPGIRYVEIHHAKANVASSGVPRRLGFRVVGEGPS